MAAIISQISFKQPSFSEQYSYPEQTACDKPTLQETKQGQPMHIYICMVVAVSSPCADWRVNTSDSESIL